jgi:hypothetical protein
MDTVHIQRGVPFNATITISEDSVTPAVALNLTGLIVFISIKTLQDYLDDDTAAVISSKISSHTNAVNGITEWSLTAIQTLIPVGRYKADVRVYTSSLVFINSDTFYIEIEPIVTKRLT